MMMESRDVSEIEDMSSLHGEKDMDSKTQEKKINHTLKHKPIQKAKKKNEKELLEKVNKSSEITSNYSFSFSNSDSQKFQTLWKYFSASIHEHYKSSASTSFFRKLIDENLIALPDLFHNDLSRLWKGSCEGKGYEIFSYLSLISEIKKQKNQYKIVQSEDGKIYCVFQTPSCRFTEISALESKVLMKRSQFLDKLGCSLDSFLRSGRNMSELSFQITFLYYCLCETTKLLKQKERQIEQNLVKMEQEPLRSLSGHGVEPYLELLMKKNICLSLQDQDINYLNFYRNKEIEEHELESKINAFSAISEYEDFIKKKRHLKSIRSSKSILHTACLGCFSYHSEQYNTFLFCHDCGIRFHRVCYQGVSYTEKNHLCLQCSKKRVDATCKRIKKKQCMICGMKELLYVQAESQNNNNKIHIFCMVMNGLWKIKEDKLACDLEIGKMQVDSNKCILCGISNSYSRKCQNCSNYAHHSCAFLHGWKMRAHFEGNQKKPNVVMECCAENNESRLKRRCFILNYKREAFKKNFSIP